MSTQELNAEGIRRKDATETISKLFASLRPMPFALKIAPPWKLPTLCIGNYRRLSGIYGDLRSFFCKAMFDDGLH